MLTQCFATKADDQNIIRFQCPLSVRRRGFPRTQEPSQQAAEDRDSNAVFDSIFYLQDFKNFRLQVFSTFLHIETLRGQKDFKNKFSQMAKNNPNTFTHYRQIRLTFQTSAKICLNYQTALLTILHINFKNENTDIIFMLIFLIHGKLLIVS